MRANVSQKIAVFNDSNDTTSLQTFSKAVSPEALNEVAITGSIYSMKAMTQLPSFLKKHQDQEDKLKWDLKDRKDGL